MTLRRVLARAERAVSLDLNEVVALLGARDDDLRALCEIAAGMRDRATGTVTYSPKVFLPVTHLCRDRCHYCTFATDPATLRRTGRAPFLEIDEAVAVAAEGAKAGCAEALLTLGDTPEDRWPVAREWLDERGYDSTSDYVRAVAIAVLERTGLLPHANPGVMTWEQLMRLRPVAPSMGMMLETTSSRLFETPGEVHYGSPDKNPQVRLRVLRDAGRLAIPFTTGLLIGIGETLAERADSLLALRTVEREFHGIQEVIIQNFRAKPGTAMAGSRDADLQEYLAAIATARVVLGSSVHLQAPPNLTDEAELAQLLAAGIDDWGGVSPVTADFVNPERPWPSIETLREVTTASGLELRPRLTIHPEFIARGDAWLDPRLKPFVAALADSSGLLDPQRRPTGRPWQEEVDYEGFAAAGSGRTDLAVTIDIRGRDSERRSDFDTAFGSWEALSTGNGPAVHVGDFGKALDLALADPAALADEAHEDLALALFAATGDQVALVAGVADDLRRRRVGDEVTYVVNRNINFTNVCYTGCRFCAFAQRESDADAFTLSSDEIAGRVREAVAAGATEICMQGGIHPRLPGTAYFDLARTVKTADPGIHLHAFSPMEVVNGATRCDLSVGEFLARAKDAGLDSIPGTAAEILDDDVRWVLTKGKLPTSAWVEVVTEAHRLGLPSSSTMMYGHVDTPVHWVRHLRLLRRIQEQTGGFTEFVGLPFVHNNAPLYLAGKARAGSTVREDILVTAMARLMLDGAIDNIQVSWVKLGPAGAAHLLAAGANDLGGTLMEETISRMAGSAHGSSVSVEQLHQMAALAGRPARQRTTGYGQPSPDPHAGSDRAARMRLH
ncbi:MAG: bifunctional FO biosynthesis protein CofGH [Candidatus Nanopelagicales bacterium]|nr:bifunctional FO biosynthesis protein CofGH [Candidatus Nanopelagicales bacterium]